MMEQMKLNMCAFACVWAGQGQCIFFAEFKDGTKNFRIYETLDDLRGFRERLPSLHGFPTDPLRVDVFIMTPRDAVAFDNAPMSAKYDFFCRHGVRVHEHEESQEEEMDALILYGVIDHD